MDKEASPNWNNVKERQFLPQFNDPRFGNSTRIGVHATVWRLQPNNKYSLFFSGMRNPYDFAFNLAGEAFTFDSDMEWDVNAPWYREVRTVHMIPGGDGGYRNGTGKFQDEYFDIIPALRHLRRGSPVGVEFYQSYAYPENFFDNLFEADWSRGRLLYTALTPERRDLHGPRGSRRVRPRRADADHRSRGRTRRQHLPDDRRRGRDRAVSTRSLDRSEAGAAGHDRHSRGRAAAAAALELGVGRDRARESVDGRGVRRRAREAGAQRHRRAARPLARAARDAAARRRAERGAAAGADQGSQADVRAAAAYVAGLHTSDDAKAVAAAALKDTIALVQRRAAEALVRQGLNPSAPSFAPIADIYALLRSPDRFVRYSGRVALEHTPKDQWMKLVMAETNVIALTEGLVALANTTPEAQSQSELRPVFEKLVALMQRTTLTPDEKIRVLRTFEVAAAQTPSGVDPEIKKQVHAALIKQLPDRGAGGDVGPLHQPDGPARPVHAVPADASPGQGARLHRRARRHRQDPGGHAEGRRGSARTDRLHVFAARDRRGLDAAQKQQVIDWFAKASKWRGGSTFAGHVNNIFDATIDAFSRTRSRWPTRRRRCSRRSPRKWRRRLPRSGRGAGRGGGRGRGPQRAARSPGALRQPRVPARRRPGLAGRPRRRPQPGRGRRVFRDTCAQCHRFGTLGKDYAPDLTRVAERLPRRDILRSIFFPTEKVDPKFATTVLATKDGRRCADSCQRNRPERGAEDRRGTGAGDRGEDPDREANDRSEVDHARRHRRQGHRRRRARRHGVCDAGGQVTAASLAAASILLGAARLAAAQDAATIAVREGLGRNIYVTVVDEKGVASSDLTSQEVELKEDGAVRSVLAVKPATETMQIVLLVDDSGAGINDVREGVAGFIRIVQRTAEIAIVSTAKQNAVSSTSPAIPAPSSTRSTGSSRGRPPAATSSKRFANPRSP